METSIWEEIWNVYGTEFDIDLIHFVAFYIAMAAGAVLYFYFDVKHSLNTNQDTPKKFSWKFMFLDNMIRFITILILIAVGVLFYEDIYGVSLNVKLAFMQGLSIDALIGVLMKRAKEKGPLKKQRDHLNNKYKNT